MFDIGLQELVLIFVIALLVFGPKNLPQLGRSLGRAMREFRKASDEFKSTIETNLQMNEIDPPPTLQPAGDVPALPLETPAPAATAEPVLDPEGASVAQEAASPPGEPYVAQRGARLFHGRECGWLKKVSEADRVYFKRVAEAREAGFVNCPACDPWEPT
jgi:sec-independent protein translocase protein TatA